MGVCAHIWVPLSHYQEECVRCGARQTPGTRHVHMQSGEIVEVPPRTIPTFDIQGEPLNWPPINEQESHD